MEKLSERKLRRLIAEDFLFFKRTTSTFDWFEGSPFFSDGKKRAGQPKLPPKLVIAAEQRGGRGRFERAFFSPKGGIYFCLAVPILPHLTINAAAGVMRALVARGLDPRVKWVNDVLLGGRKVCGILARADAGGGAIVGVGINYCIKKFPADIKDRAGSIFESTTGINEFAALAIASVKQAIFGEAISGESGKKGEEIGDNFQFYKSRLHGKGGDIKLPDGRTAIALDIDDNGHLIYSSGGENGVLSCGDIII